MNKTFNKYWLVVSWFAAIKALVIQVVVVAVVVVVEHVM